VRHVAPLGHVPRHWPLQRRDEGGHDDLRLDHGESLIARSAAANGVPPVGLAEHTCIRAGGRGRLDRHLACRVPSISLASLFTLTFLPLLSN
jgi:hypothetical protein